MRLTGAMLLWLVPACAQMEPKEIVRKSVAADMRGIELRRNYTYKELDVRHDASGAAHSTLNEVLYVGGRPYRHPIARDGKPLPEAEAQASKAALDKAVQDASRLTPEERKQRGDAYLKARAKEREDFKYVPDAFNFRIVGEPVIEGREAWQIEAKPRKEYSGPLAFAFHHMEGTMWIDKKDFQWVKVEADSKDTISFGWFLARIAKGTRISIENMRLNDELWAPKRVMIHASGRIALVKKVSAEQDMTFSDYRRFQTDSKMVGFETDK